MAKFFCFLFMFLSIHQGANCTQEKNSVTFPVRSNIYFIIDYDDAFREEIHNTIGKIFNGISLMKFRIAAYTTTGVERGIVDFISANWLMNDIEKGKGKVALRKALRTAKKQAKQYFYDDENIFVAIVNRNTMTLLHGFNYVVDVSETKTSLEKMINDLPFYIGDFRTCAIEGQTVYDECDQECTCLNGAMSNCARIRERFSHLSLEKRVRYIETFKNMRYNNRFKERYSWLSLVHPTLEIGVNGKLSLSKLPFHREYSLMMESILRLIDCRTTIPYWFWLQRGEDIFKPGPVYHIWDDNGGMGSTSTNYATGFCLQSGPFKESEFSYPDAMANELKVCNVTADICKSILNYHYSTYELDKCITKFEATTYNPACVVRYVHNYTLPMKTIVDGYQMLVNTPPEQFFWLSQTLFGKFHNPLHKTLGGIMSTGCASFAPEFFTSHTMLDGMWDFWQNKGPEYKQVLADDYTPTLVFNSPRLYFVDNNNLGLSNTRVKYSPLF